MPKKPAPKRAPQVNVLNRKARFSYQLLKHYTAGMVLSGTEIKAIRAGLAQLKDAYCYFSQGELWVKGLHIGAYKPAGSFNHEPERPRKLLLKRRELAALWVKKELRGHTIVPLRLFLSAKGWAKLEVALAIGKKRYDKRASLKERDLQRRLRSTL